MTSRLATAGTGAVLAVALVAALLSSVAAYAAFHVVQDFDHGIGQSGCPANLQNCSLFSRITDVDGTAGNAQLWASMYHLRDDGGWNLQCADVQVAATSAICFGSSGTLPCRKYAWTQGIDPTSSLGWHGHNPAIC